MSIGAMIGGNLISSGMQLFGTGVGLEYDRAAQERQRRWQHEDMQGKWKAEFHQKMAMAKQYGIHPLAIMGLPSTSPNSPIPVGSAVGALSDSFGRMGQGISNAIQARELQKANDLSSEEQKARTRLLNAQASNYENNTPEGINFGGPSQGSGLTQQPGNNYGGISHAEPRDKVTIDTLNRGITTPQDSESFSFDEAPPDVVYKYIRNRGRDIMALRRIRKGTSSPTEYRKYTRALKKVQNWIKPSKGMYALFSFADNDWVQVPYYKGIEKRLFLEPTRAHKWEEGPYAINPRTRKKQRYKSNPTWSHDYNNVY